MSNTRPLEVKMTEIVWSQVACSLKHLIEETSNNTAWTQARLCLPCLEAALEAAKKKYDEDIAKAYANCYG